jgi:decaprenyl-phosphate phosphoribosyltransferase
VAQGVGRTVRRPVPFDVVVSEEVRLRPDDGSSVLSGLVRTARPKQWLKNVLVFAAPGAAGVLTEAVPLRNTVIAFVAFCLAASGTYCLNDAADVESDRRHPTKRNRPVAAGVVPVTTARVAGLVLVTAGIGISFFARWELAATVAAYVALTTAYSLSLKHIAVVDIVAVAAGFVLRAVGGATATGVPISNWFFIVASFGALFMVAGKRHAETKEIGADASQVRSTLGEYSDSYLTYLRAVSSSAVLIGYCLWAFEKANESVHPDPWYQVSIGPFVLGVLRYALLIDKGQGSAPEDVVLGDRPLQVIGVLWVITFGLGVYLT